LLLINRQYEKPKRWLFNQKNLIKNMKFDQYFPVHGHFFSIKPAE
jgi:hypothetical protein